METRGHPTGDTMLYINGSKNAFRCDCGANVFKKAAEAAERIKYRCNGCGATYSGEREAAPRILTPADANQPRDIASAGHATTCGTCLTALTEEPHRPGCPEPGYIAERERVSALVRAARRWAAVASDTGRPAEEMIAADLELAEAVDALDGAASAQRPRDLAGRIRALVQEYAGRWADETDAGTADAYEEVVRTLRACLTSVRVGFPGSVQAAADALRAEAAIPGRYSRSNASAVAPLTQAADDLERIVRECGEPKR